MRRLDDAERESLHAAARHERFRFDLVRDGITLRQIEAQGSVSLNRFDSIERTARLTIYDENVDWLKDKIKPYLLLDVQVKRVTCRKIDALGLTCAQRDDANMTCAELETGELFSLALPLLRSWTTFDATGNTQTLWEVEQWEFPLGLFIPSTPARKTDADGMSGYDVSMYDCTVILREDCLTERLFFAAGTAYLTAVKAVLVGAGVTDVTLMDESAAVLPTDREFETGMEKLAIINQLLSEINYNKLRCDADGRFILSQYRQPTAASIDYTYAADELSVIETEVSSEQDFYKVPNVFVVTMNNPELDSEMHARFVNDNPASRLSTVQRGRSIVKVVEPPDAVTSQADLDEYLRRQAFEISQVYEDATFYTALMPMHGSGDVLAISHPELSGIYQESAWGMELTAGGRMTHEARRLVEL